MRPAGWWNANPDETPVPGSAAAQMRADLARMTATARMAQLTINASVFRAQQEKQHWVQEGLRYNQAVALGSSFRPARLDRAGFDLSRAGTCPEPKRRLPMPLPGRNQHEAGSEAVASSSGGRTTRPVPSKVAPSGAPLGKRFKGNQADIGNRFGSLKEESSSDEDEETEITKEQWPQGLWGKGWKRYRDEETNEEWFFKQAPPGCRQYWAGWVEGSDKVEVREHPEAAEAPGELRRTIPRLQVTPFTIPESWCLPKPFGPLTKAMSDQMTDLWTESKQTL